MSDDVLNSTALVDQARLVNGLQEDEVRSRMQRYETYFAVPREPLG